VGAAPARRRGVVRSWTPHRVPMKYSAPPPRSERSCATREVPLPTLDGYGLRRRFAIMTKRSLLEIEASSHSPVFAVPADHAASPKRAPPGLVPELCCEIDITSEMTSILISCGKR